MRVAPFWWYRPYQIEVKHSEPAYTAVIRSRVRHEELKKFVPAACGEVWSFVRSAGIPKPGRHVALYLGDAQGSVEVGAEVGERFAGNDRVQCSQLPAGRVATAVHFGPYGRLGEAHAAIREWCLQHGYRLSKVSWEGYGHWPLAGELERRSIQNTHRCFLSAPGSVLSFMRFAPKPGATRGPAAAR